MSKCYPGITIYSTSSGGSGVQRFTERMRSIVKGCTKTEPPVVYLDMEENKECRSEVWSISNKKGVYPLLFVGEEFVGDKDQVEELNEMGQLSRLLGGSGGALVPDF
jgi:glutaredoxin-related protein